MKRVYFTVLLSSLLVIAVLHGFQVFRAVEGDSVKVGFVFVGDSGTTYTKNFVVAMEEIGRTYGDKVELFPKYNVPENNTEGAFSELVAEGCDIIFSTSYGYGETAKKFAEQNPEIEFCQATCSNAGNPVLPNYHTFMGEIHEGRYISGVVAGMKMKSLIDNGKITTEEAKIGYVAAYPYAEVISGYTAFLLGVQCVVPEATMDVIYTDSWSNFNLEKAAAERLIAEKCVIISQHSDTAGPAVACENTDKSVEVYCVSYNRSMADIAPTTYLTGCRINWNPYMVAAVGAVIDGRTIEDRIEGNHYPNDVGAGFNKDWVCMLSLNEYVAAPGSAEKIDELIKQFKRGKIQVFKGNHKGVDPFNENDTIDLNSGYEENASGSAPSFHYVLNDVITILE